MTLLTIFSAPKPFTNPHIATIQRNAIASWLALPGVEVILLGDEPGLAEAAAELGVTHIRDIPRSESGAPRMDAMFRLAREASPTPFYCITNADIILFDDLLTAMQAAASQTERFVLMGQRWDADIIEPLDFSEGWQDRLRNTVHATGTLHRPAGSDYFLFPATCYTKIPPFVIGRAGWDNWMIYHARKSGFAAIDATHDVMIVHQNHDYAHLPGGQPHYRHPETDENIQLAGGRIVTRLTLWDTNARLVVGKVQPHRISLKRFWHWLVFLPLLTFNSPTLSLRLWNFYHSMSRKKA
jgi:hypothetical protein